MKIRITNFILLAMVTALAVTCTAAQEREAAGGGRLAGTWDADVTIRTCATGEAITSFRSIASFNQGGTSIGSTGGILEDARTRSLAARKRQHIPVQVQDIPFPPDRRPERMEHRRAPACAWPGQ
jgi:hypothetical protein